MDVCEQYQYLEQNSTSQCIRLTLDFSGVRHNTLIDIINHGENRRVFGDVAAMNRVCGVLVLSLSTDIYNNLSLPATSCAVGRPKTGCKTSLKGPRVKVDGLETLYDSPEIQIRSTTLFCFSRECEPQKV